MPFTIIASKTPISQGREIARLIHSLKDQGVREIGIVFPAQDQSTFTQNALTAYNIMFQNHLGTPFLHTPEGSLCRTFLSFLQKQEIPEYISFIKHPLVWSTLPHEDHEDIHGFIKKLTRSPKASLNVGCYDVPLLQKHQEWVICLKKYIPHHVFQDIQSQAETTQNTTPHFTEMELYEHVISHMPRVFLEQNRDATVHLVPIHESFQRHFEHIIVADMNDGDLGDLKNSEHVESFLTLIENTPSITIFYAKEIRGEEALPHPFLKTWEGTATMVTGENFTYKTRTLHQQAPPPPVSLPQILPAPMTVDGTHKPHRLSPTAIGHLMTNPYGFYVRYILKIFPREDMHTLSFALVFGQALHRALDTYTKNGGGFVEGDASILFGNMEETLRAEHFPISPLTHIRLFEIAKALCKYTYPLSLKSELTEEKMLNIEGREVTLFARLDALVNKEDGPAIWDYKTGVLPGIGEISSGRAPQLPLEGLIFQNDSTLPHLIFVKFNTKPPYVEWKPLKNSEILIKQAEEGVTHILAHYLSSTFGFYSTSPHTTAFRPFAHLERIAL